MLWVSLQSKLTVSEAAHVVVQLEGDGHQVLQARPVVGRTGETLLLKKCCCYTLKHLGKKGLTTKRKGLKGEFYLKSTPAHV